MLKDTGSPPPMRGKVLYITPTMYNARITPAYAGKSQPPSGQRLKLRDHPRLCGEKLSGAAATVVTTGSPPPMRGKVWQKAFIEAVYRDHPRLCGEKLNSVICYVIVSRITPAYAGKRFADYFGVTTD